jgi:hypothetical protein
MSRQRYEPESAERKRHSDDDAIGRASAVSGALRCRADQGSGDGGARDVDGASDCPVPGPLRHGTSLSRFPLVAQPHVESCRFPSLPVEAP